MCQHYTIKKYTIAAFFICLTRFFMCVKITEKNYKEVDKMAAEISKDKKNEQIKYYKLFDMLNRQGKKKKDLLDILSPATVTKLSKHGIVTTDTIGRICEYLNCQPGDIMEYETKEE